MSQDEEDRQKRGSQLPNIGQLEPSGMSNQEVEIGPTLALLAAIFICGGGTPIWRPILPLFLDRQDDHRLADLRGSHGKKNRVILLRQGFNIVFNGLD